LATTKPEMETFLDALRDRQELYGADTTDLEQLLNKLKQASDLSEFLKSIGAPDDQSSTRPSLTPEEIQSLQKKLAPLKRPDESSTSTLSSPEEEQP